MTRKISAIPPLHDRAQKTGEILLAVWRVVATRGLGAVSIRSVAKEAGVSAGRVQHYFETKDDLIRASVELMIGTAESVHREATNQAEPTDELWHLLVHAIPHAAESPAGTSVFYSFVAASVGDPHIARILADARRGSTREIARLLRGLDAPSPEQTAQELQATADGATLGVLIGSLAPDQARAVVRSVLNRVLK